MARLGSNTPRKLPCPSAFRCRSTAPGKPMPRARSWMACCRTTIANARRCGSGSALHRPTRSTFLWQRMRRAGCASHPFPSRGEIASQAREFAREKDIAIKVYRLGRGWTTWQSDDRRSRFALAGSQGKFALERFDDRWTWPNAKHPSTHIVKPPHERFCGTPLVEDATMYLAAACGLDVARSFVRSFGEDQAYVVERFDREVCADGQVLRIHVEDFTQALGISRHAKYSVAAADAFALLKGLSNGRSLVREWAKQLVFNTLVGNCDAHGKNYSLFLRPDGSVDLCPLYDALCTRVWQETSDLLAMPINSKNRASELSLSDWAAEAAASGICEDDLVGAVEAIAAQIATHAPAVLAEYPDWIQEAMTAAIAADNRRLFQELGLRLER